MQVGCIVNFLLRIHPQCSPFFCLCHSQFFRCEWTAVRQSLGLFSESD